MKNVELVNAVNAIHAIIQKDNVMPVRVSYALTKNFNAFIGELDAYEKERKKLVDSGEKNFDEKLQELLEIETEVPVHKISMEQLEKCDCLTIKEVALLDFMIEEEV